MIRGFKRPPSTKLLRRLGQGTPLMPARENGEPLVDVVNGFLQRCREFLSLLYIKQFIQHRRPRFLSVGSSPRCELGSKRPHGQRESSEPDAFFSEFEELSIAERRVILLLMNPVFGQ